MTNEFNPRSIPNTKILIVLIGFPLLYMINSFMPWAEGIMEGNRNFFIPFWLSIVVLHWSSTVASYRFGKQHGFRLEDFGITISRKKIFIGLLIYFLLALVLLFITNSASPDLDDSKFDKIVYNFYPITLVDRLFWILIALSAGICEEFVYRGFGMAALKSKKLPNWIVVVLTSISFVFIHGLAAFEMFPFYLAFGIFFGILRLWKNSIILNIIIHTLIDLSVMTMVFA